MSIEKIEKIYKFKNPELLECVLIHPSFYPSNEFKRLEFLGDKILACELTKYLYDKSNYNSDRLSITICELVKKESLSIVGRFLVDDIKFHGILTDSIIAACLEAWIAGVYLDEGPINELVLSLWKPLLNNCYNKDPKNQVQEVAQQNNIPFNYEFIEKNQSFICVLSIGKYLFQTTGVSKKIASREAANKFLNELNNDKLKF